MLPKTWNIYLILQFSQQVLCFSTDLGWVWSEKKIQNSVGSCYLTKKKKREREILYYWLKDWLGLPQGMVVILYISLNILCLKQCCLNVIE